MTTPREAEIKKRLEAATPGPWARGPGLDGVESDAGLVAVTTNQHPTRYQCEYDALFIANAPFDIAYLLGELEQARDQLGRAREILDPALALLWETQSELSPQPNGYRVKGSAEKAFARLMDNYDIVISAGWDAKQRLTAPAVKPSDALCGHERPFCHDTDKCVKPSSPALPDKGE